MAKATSDSFLNWAAGEIRAMSHGYATEPRSTCFVIDQMRACLDQNELHSMLTLVFGARLFTKNSNFSRHEAHEYLKEHILKDLDRLVSGDKLLTIGRREELACFLEILHACLPEDSVFEPSMVSIAA